MGYFILNSDITIGTFRFAGVHEVRIRRTIHSYNDTATITIPAICRIAQGRRAMPAVLVTGTLFDDGAPVTIKLGYNGRLKEEFVGFVRRRGTGMPLVVECEGYIRQLRLGKNPNKISVNGDYRTKPTSAAKLLALATKGTDITVVCPVDFPIIGVKLVNANGVQVCDLIKEISMGALAIFFIEPQKLYCGLIYTATNNNANPFDIGSKVDYRLGYNCPKQNALKERVPSEPFNIVIKGKLATGGLLYSKSKIETATHTVTRLSSQIPDNKTMQAFAQEIATGHNYTGYEGNLTGFLEPYAVLGESVHVVNSEYADLDGMYLIDGIEVVFGVRGARRIVSVGPRLDEPAAVHNSGF